MTALFLLWIFFNARLTWDVIMVGLFICLLVGILLRAAIDYSPRKELRFLMRLPAIARYLAVLFKEIVMANWQMVKIIVNPFSRIEGQLTFFTAKDLKTPYGRSLLGNSITITPGTITVQLKNGRYCVHGLRADFVDGIEDSTLAREAARLEAKFGK